MSDRIQEDLLAWVLRGDRARGGAALDALAREWRPRVMRFLVAPGPDEVEEVLDEALCALGMADPGQRPRALAPDDVESAPAWRRQVLRHYLIDRSRKRGRRRHAEQGMALGLSNAAEAEAWRSDRTERGSADPAPSGAIPLREVVAPAPLSTSSEQIELGAMRLDVLRVLPSLAVRRKVLLLLALGGDPSPFCRALADALGENEADVYARVQAALTAPHDGAHEHLSDAMIRVIWLNEPLAKARDTARKNLERAVSDIRQKLGLKT